MTLFTTEKKIRCLYCGKEIPESKFVYNKRFCDFECRSEYNNIKGKLLSKEKRKYWLPYRDKILKAVDEKMIKLLKERKEE